MGTLRVRVEDGVYLVVARDADLAEALADADLGATALDMEAHAEVLFVSTISSDVEFVELEVRQLITPPEYLLDELAAEWGPWVFGQIHGNSPLDVQTVEREPVGQATRSAGAYDVALFGRVDRRGHERHLMLVWPEPWGIGSAESTSSRDQDALYPFEGTLAEAEAEVTVDDDRVRVTTWTFPETGASTGQHVHEHDYVVVPVTGGTFRVTMADGSLRELSQEAGVPYRGTAGTAHEVVNGGDGPAVFVEVELKG